MTGHTRRAVLGLLGCAALAGCSALSSDPVSERTELDGAALRGAVTGERIDGVGNPVEIGADYRHSIRGRAEDDLESVPDPLTAEDIPNAEVRDELGGFRERARNALDAAEEAAGAGDALNHLRDARKDAAAIAAGWAFTRGAFGPDDLADRRAALGEDAAAFAETWSYEGDDPVCATAVHAAIESRYRQATGEAAATFDREARVVPLAEAARETAGGRTALATARHLNERYRASLSDPTDYRATIEAAGDALAARIRERRRSLPEARDPDELVSDLEPRGIGWYAIENAARGAEERLGDASGPATRLSNAVGTLANIAAFESVLETLRSEPAAFDVTSAEQVAERRSAALTAIERARESERTALARRPLEAALGSVRYADRAIGRAADAESVAVERITLEVSYYVQAAAIARAAPDAAARAAAALADG